MEITPTVSRITIYPVKSLDGISLSKARIGTGGSLEHDREYAICGSNGKFVNGKSNALVHVLRSDIDLENELISFRHESATAWHQFHLQHDTGAIDEFLSAFFNMPVTFQKNTEGEFLDIPVKSGVTVLSTASLETVSTWFDHMKLEEARKRFRATIEIDHVPAFWEDRLFYREETVVEFKIGEIMLYGMSPRARCVVPTRHPQTGEGIHAFQKTFAIQRAGSQPAWSSLDVYGHTYYLSVDCYIPPSEFGKSITIGDEIKIIGKKILTEALFL
ncbi:MAG: MOSC N-terminal beta barrel domain-containing protein [Ferruginibacter sp.]